MRTLLCAVLLTLLVVTSGCGGSSDPRANPEFNEAAIDPANAARPGMTPGQDVKPTPTKQP